MTLSAPKLLPVVALLVALGGCSAPSPRPLVHAAEPGVAAFDALVVGTAHRGHLQVADYPLSKLDALVDAFQPDLVLVEIRPEAYAEGKLEDGPLEMSYLTLLARKRGIAVAPIDWFPEDLVSTAADDPMAEQAYEAEVGALGREVDSFASFAVLNGEARARQWLDVDNAAARHGLASNVRWHRRQAYFHQRATAAIAQAHARRVAAFVGFAHRAELALWLAGHGGRLHDPVALADTQTKRGAGTVEEDVLTMWRAGIARLKIEAARASPPLQKKLRRKIRYWEIAVERRGACCVEDAVFAVDLGGEATRGLRWRPTRQRRCPATRQRTSRCEVGSIVFGLSYDAPTPMPSSPRRAQPDETYRDARQIGQVGRFFDDLRPAGVVAFSPLRWSSLLGRPGAMAWLLCSRAATKSGKPTVAENALAALLASPFEREPARYRLYETGAPPIALPTLPSGYVQAAAPLGDDGAVFVVRDSVVARAACTSVVERAGAGGFAPLGKAAFSRTLPPGRSLSLAQQVVALSKKRGALPVPISAANQLARATGISRAAATALFAGEGCVPYERPFSPLDFDYAAELLDACLGDDPDAPFAPLGSGPRDTNSGVARMIARHEALTQGRDAPFVLAPGAGRARPGIPCVSLRTTRDRAKTQRVTLAVSERVAAAIRRIATKRAADFVEAEADLSDASSAAVALQALRVQEGIDVFRRVMRELARAAGDDAEAAIDFVYAHTEIG